MACTFRCEAAEWNSSGCSRAQVLDKRAAYSTRYEALMLQRITVAGFATSGVLFTLVGLLPAFRGGHLNVVFFVLGVVFLILGMALGAAFGRSRAP